MNIATENDGPKIARSSYWGSDYERHGKYVLSTNAGVIRLLVPRNNNAVIADMVRNCDYVIFNTGHVSELGQQGIQIVFEDHTQEPFVLFVTTASVLDFLPGDPPEGRWWRFSIWSYENNKPVLKFEAPCVRRRLERLHKSCHGLSRQEEKIFKQLIAGTAGEEGKSDSIAQASSAATNASRSQTEPQRLMAKILGSDQVHGKRYGFALNKDLEDWYCYVGEAGHCILSVCRCHFHSTNDLTDLLVPVPVRAVIRGYSVERGHIVVDLPYDSSFGVVVRDNDYEF